MKRRKNIFKWLVFIFVVYTLITLLVQYYSIYTFWIGFHNADLSYNGLGSGKTHDRITTNETMKLEDLWIIGMDGMKTAFFGFLFSIFMSMMWMFFLWKLIEFPLKKN